MPFKVAIFGCGMIAGAYEDFAADRTYSHAKAYAEHPAFDGIGLYDLDRGKADALAAKCGGSVFDDPAALLDGFRPDVVSVCTPDDRHVPDLELLLTHPNGPRVVFCEKPVCATAAELDRLEGLERDSGRRVIVNHSRRFDSAHRDLRDLIRRGSLGVFVQGHVDYYGGWRHLGVHLVDILQYLLERDFEPRYAVYRCNSKYANDPTLDVEGGFGGGPLRFSGFPEPLYQIVDMALMFERGQVKITDFGQRIDVLRRTVNAEHENVLEPDPATSGPALTRPMPEAVDILAGYLADPDPARLDPFGLAQARRTMQTLWKGSALHAS